MTKPSKSVLVTIALVGNPNTGKSTLFNALCGLRQRVGNYPGVTVEKKVGHMQLDGRRCSVLDLPGSYSLAPRSPDEMVAVDVLLGRRSDTEVPDAIVCILDATNIERNLYLVSQVLELRRPTVIVLNMMDVARERGIGIEVDELRRRLGVPVVETEAHRRLGIDRLKSAIVEVIQCEPTVVPSPFPEVFQEQIAELERLQSASGGLCIPRYLIERLLLDTSGYLAGANLPGVDARLLEGVAASRLRLAECGFPVPGVETSSRYRWAGGITQGVVTRTGTPVRGWTDRIDRVVTHRVWGTFIFVVAMALLFQSVFYIAKPASAGIEWLNGIAADWVASHVAAGPLQSLLIHGVIEGAAGMLVFLPQIMILFFFIGVLEDCGYMARAAYLMDRVMSAIGLSGKSFIPLLSSFACAIPGIMAARVIENRRDRLITILIAPLMSCSARLPVYTLLIAAFVPDRHWFGGLVGLQGLTVFSMYALGLIAAACVALVLRKTILQGDTPPFIMELPGYKVPGLSLVLHRMAERAWDFLTRAGTLILAVTVVVWAAAYFPHGGNPALERLEAEHAVLDKQAFELRAAPATADSERELRVLADRIRAVEVRQQGEQLRNSFLGYLGRVIEPAVKPLGWDWRIGCAVLASFPAREVVIGTLGVIYNLGDPSDARPENLYSTLRAARWEDADRPVFTVPVAFSLLVFFALCAQCASTLVIMWRETGSWKWPALAFCYMTVMAYLAAFVAYQVGSWLTSG